MGPYLFLSIWKLNSSAWVEKKSVYRYIMGILMHSPMWINNILRCVVKNNSIAAVSFRVLLLLVHLCLINLLYSRQSLLHSTLSAPPHPSTSVPYCSTILFSASFLFSLHWFVHCAFIALLFSLSLSLSPCPSVWLLNTTIPQLWGWLQTSAGSAVSSPRPAPHSDLSIQCFCTAKWEKVQ